MIRGADADKALIWVEMDCTNRRMNESNQPQSISRSRKSYARLRMALYMSGCLFVFAGFFSIFGRLDDMNVSEQERIAIFTWSHLKLRVYFGVALCSFLAAIVLSVWARRRQNPN
jgi:hypothetical protein